MGIDPMTHRPRTDFFAALPQLIALANLHQLIEQQQWDGHTTMQQTEGVQADNHQYMQAMLQSAASSTTPNPITVSSLTTDLEQISLLNPQHMLSPTLLESIDGEDIARQVPQNQPITFFDQPVSNINLSSDNNVGSSERCLVEGGSSSQKSILLSENSLPPLTDMSASNPRNAISTLKCGASSTLTLSPSWSEILLDEELMREFE
jgi:myb proto-oncogene protein